MTPERIAELRARWSTGPTHIKGGATEQADIAQMHEAIDAIDAAQKEIEALREEVLLTNEHEHAIMVELVGKRCEDGDWVLRYNHLDTGVCKSFAPGADRPYLHQGGQFRFARLAR